MWKSWHQSVWLTDRREASRQQNIPKSIITPSNWPLQNIYENNKKGPSWLWMQQWHWRWFNALCAPHLPSTSVSWLHIWTWLTGGLHIPRGVRTLQISWMLQDHVGRASSMAPILPGAVAQSAAGMGCCKHRWRHSRLSPPSPSCNQGKFSKFVQRENPWLIAALING